MQYIGAMAVANCINSRTAVVFIITGQAKNAMTFIYLLLIYFHFKLKELKEFIKHLTPLHTSRRHCVKQGRLAAVWTPLWTDFF